VAVARLIRRCGGGYDRPVSVVVIIGTGDMGERLAAGLAVGGRVRRLVLAGRSSSALTAVAATLASVSDCLIEPVQADAMQHDEVAELLARTKPDLVVQCAALRSPWALAGRDDAAARAVIAAGLGLRLPYQLPVVLSVMRAAKHAGYAGPTANLSFPDVTGPILRRLGLTPTLGLGNAGMMLRRVRAALRAAEPETDVPLVRILGHHSQVYAVMQAQEPADSGERCRVYLGEDGQRDDAVAYRAPALAPGLRYNAVTAAAGIPVLEALLPGSAPLRWSTPAPVGLAGGYPVLIANGAVTLDLPPGLTQQDAIAFNENMARGDGIERIDDDGTVHFTAASRDAVAGIGPGLAEPLAIDDLQARATALDAALGTT
jgi:hypothetical protein